MNRGTLTVICGCMFAGKTSRLIELLTDARDRGRRAIAIKHSLDARYDRTDLATHDGRHFPARTAATAEQLIALTADFDVIGIDEAQFFGPPLIDAVKTMRDAGRELFASGIDYDTWGRPFDPFPELLHLADETDILTIPCARCGKPARMNQRLTPVIDGNLIGGPGDYEPRCPACFVPLAQAVS
ncbi:MAG: thymidine kinase [Phycisphaerae bacterium]